MLTYDPRTISAKVYKALKQTQTEARSQKDNDEQRNQAVELYTYLAAWGLLRLKGEDPALRSKPQKQAIIQCFFNVLGDLAYPGQIPNPLAGVDGINELITLEASDYLGLTGLALQVAREFAFWAEAIYPKVTSAMAVTVATTTLEVEGATP